MPRWIPEKIWNDQEVFIIGGGESLKDFDFKLLESCLTIGCNDAYTHGEKICKICIFGDKPWFKAHEYRLSSYKNAVFTNCSQMFKTKIPWVWTLQREARGIHANSLGWNKNTGASAVNLAVLLGASKIYLLGFDMKLSKSGRANWHNNLIDKPNADKYLEFLVGFEYVAKDLKSKHPEIKIINITDDSELNLFPKIGVKEFWDKRKSYEKLGVFYFNGSRQ